jgi:hypothetical protein
MAKLSVSIPDALLEEAQALEGKSGSELVQDALHSYVRRRAPKPDNGPNRPPDAADLVRKALEDLKPELESEYGPEARYRRGYRRALEGAKVIGVEALRLLAALDWDVQDWANDLQYYSHSDPKQSAEPDEDQAYWRGIFGGGDVPDRMSDLLEKEGWFSDEPFAQGFSDALRDLWDSIMESRDDQPALSLYRIPRGSPPAGLASQGETRPQPDALQPEPAEVQHE